MNQKTILYKLAVCFCAGVFCFYTYQLISSMIQYKNASTEYNSLEEQFVTVTQSATTAPSTDKITQTPLETALEEKKEEAPSAKENDTVVPNTPPQVDFKSLQELNNDVVAWLAVPGTQINYPIVKGNNNDYYLNHTFQKKRNMAGSIFMDYQADSNLGSTNTIVYGHNMKNKSMFATLLLYKNSAFHQKYPYFWIVTPEKTYQCTIFTSYTCNIKDGIYEINMPENTFQNYLNKVVLKANYDTGILPAATDKIVTLSTCTNVNDSQRYVVQAILTEYE